MTIVTSEYVSNNPKLNETNDIVNNTIQGHKKKYGNTSVQKKIDCQFNIQFFDETKNKIFLRNVELKEH